MYTTKQLAEFVGILLGDGSISIYNSPKYSKSYRIKISSNSNEENYTLYIAKLVKSILNYNPIIKKRKGEDTRDIFIFNKNSVIFLLNLGLKKSPKWERAVIPTKFINKSYGKYVLKGYFDTDGSVVLTNNNGILYPRLEMKVSPSPMASQLITLLNFYNLKYKIYSLERGKIKIQMNGKNRLEEWIKKVGFSNEKHESRANLILKLKYSGSWI